MYFVMIMKKNLLMYSKAEKARAMLISAIAIVKSTLRPWEKQLLVHTMLPQDTKIMHHSIASNQSMKNFFTSRTSPNNLDYKAAAAEGAWAFHIAKHQQSFLSNDCTTHLIKAVFSDSDIAKKFTSARTKTASINTGVLASFAQKSLLSELGENPFSISIDASNHNEVKLFPLVVRFFSAKVGVRVRILDLRLMPCETLQQIMNFICSLEENGLKLENIISFCADNVPVNFGVGNKKEKTTFSIACKKKTVHV